MDFGHYATRAVELVNAELSDEVAIRDLVGAGTATAARVAARDVTVLRRARPELRAVFAAGAAGDQAGMVERINDLLHRYPLSPRISGHDGTGWHLHVNEDASVGQALVAEALFGLTLVVTQMGADRLGTCGAEGCEAVFVDTSPNRSKRFCSERCASRTNVAAFRRRRATAG